MKVRKTAQTHSHTTKKALVQNPEIQKEALEGSTKNLSEQQLKNAEQHK